jgi:hypothetical protein
VKYIKATLLFIGSVFTVVGTVVAVLLLAAVLTSDCTDNANGYNCDAKIEINI